MSGGQAYSQYAVGSAVFLFVYLFVCLIKAYIVSLHRFGTFFLNIPFLSMFKKHTW